MDCEAYRDDLIDVLYGEADDATRRRFSEHAAGCVACRDELPALRGLRRDLQAWALPLALVPRPARLRLAAPGWPGVAAAAALLLALGAGLSLSGAEVRYDADGFALRFGGAAAAAQAALAAHEEEHRREIAALRSAMAPDDDAEAPILRRVQELIDASESRQAAVLEAGFRDLRRETETRRRYDLARVSAGLAYIDGKTGLQSARTNQLVGQILRASQEK
jgi:anti-sigma factor RsiW